MCDQINIFHKLFLTNQMALFQRSIVTLKCVYDIGLLLLILWPFVRVADVRGITGKLRSIATCSCETKFEPFLLNLSFFEK